jgi:UDP-glucose 4-epimerase
VKAFVTGAGGFIGSHLADRLLALGHEVTGFDNFSTGLHAFLTAASKNERFRLVEADLLDFPELARAMEGSEYVFHLAANADVRFGPDHPRKDLEQNTLATSNVLEAMRATGAKRIVFASTGSVYGEPDIFPTPEDAPFPMQTSLYAASKLAAEGLISAYCAAYEFRAWIFRFVSILGERYTHGHVFDFYMQLRAHPDRLEVLGDGRQRKSYLYVQDCISAILLAIDQASVPVTILNLGTDEYCEVNDSIQWIAERLELSPQISYSGGKRGWVGDSPFIFLDCRRMRSLGWKPEVKIRDGVVRTLEFLRRNEWVLEKRC